MKAIKKKNTRVLIALLTVLGVFVGLQFLNDPLEEKTIVNKIEAPREVVSILENSCFNCHSNRPNLSWFDQIAPISWVVNKDIRRAREVLNFSEWNYSDVDHQGKMYAILNMVQSRKMPLDKYTLLHPSAKVTPEQIEIIRKYTLSLTDKQTAVDQENKIHRDLNLPENKTSKVIVSPNGVKYTDDFKQWNAISTSTFFDRSIRVIYGNDIAVKAVENDDFHPWPDGSIVVKSVWKQKELADGEIRPGEFINAQFMVKDSKKYADTEGWGFAKFSGKELVPTGKTASFAKESCIACHRQLAEKTGYLFDVPMKINKERLIQLLK
ncbi:heme-binding domain-containing protein [Sinomicrobium sp.]